MRLASKHKPRRIKLRELAPISKNPQLQSLSALFTRIAAKSDLHLMTRIAKRLKAPRTNQHPIKLGDLVKEYEKDPSIINVVIAKVLSDDTVVVMPPIEVVALRISESAKRKIEYFGGKVYKLDEIFKLDLERCRLLLGDVTKRRVYRYFGAAGDPGSTTLAKVMCKKKDVTKRPD